MKTLKERLEAKLQLDPSTDCLVWTGALFSNGYGRIRVGKSYQVVHRAVWERTFGPIPKGLFVCHHCDVRNCANLEHLFLGTKQDNSSDMVNKDRQAKGERHPKAKLIKDEVKAIRADKRFQKDIAKSYGISQTQVSKIKRRENWKYL